MLKKLSEAPTSLLLFGFGGLIPFVGGAIGLAIGGPLAIQAANALPVYAAVILSFLAGGRWATELVLRGDAPRASVLFLAIFLALAGWFAVILQVWNRPGLLINAELTGWLILMAGFAIQYLWDRGAIKGATFPGWYAPVRLLLTVGAIGSLAAAAWIRTGFDLGL